jgi:hypothetical protein
MSPHVSKNIYESITYFLENSFQLHHGMIISGHLFKSCSSVARIVVVFDYV